jgi:hypothetical protein
MIASVSLDMVSPWGACKTLDFTGLSVPCVNQFLSQRRRAV